jgi:hypothetical protein
MDATDIAMLIAAEFAELHDPARIERYRIDPPVRELQRDDVGIPFEGWTCIFNPATRSGVSFDPELKQFVVVENGVAEGSYPSLRSIFEEGRAF